MDPLEMIKVRAEKVGFSFEEVSTEFYDPAKEAFRKGMAIELQLPNGRKPRSVLINEIGAPAFNDTDFENWILLGEYAAILDTSSGTIEAMIRGYGARANNIFLQRLVKSSQKRFPDPESELDVEVNGDTSKKDVSIQLLGDSERSNRISVEICSTSLGLMTLELMPPTYSGSISLKIKNNSLKGHDQALNYLRQFSTALFFEFDLKREVTLGLQVSSSILRKRRQRAHRQPVDYRPLRIPSQKYSEEAVSLYTYGRSATGMPLLEFLAYYQVMEFYFPIYSKQELMQRARRELLDPRFDAANDSHLARLLSTLGGGPKGFMAESEQLRATLRNCTDDENLRAFIKRDAETEQFFTGRQEIKGVKGINLNNRDQRISDQVADRLYQIRCRIVHSKEDGGGLGTELLLPFGEEARKLSTDIDLARHLAQKVLITAAQSAAWS